MLFLILKLACSGKMYSSFSVQDSALGKLTHSETLRLWVKSKDYRTHKKLLRKV